MLSELAGGLGIAMLGLSGCSRTQTPEVSYQDDLTTLDLVDAVIAVKSRQVSPVELTKACLERIDRIDKHLNSFITIIPEIALEQAKQAEKAIIGGEQLGYLMGIPIAIKDNIDTAGTLTTAASAVFASRVPSKDAEVVTRLKAAGAIILGKLNMHEFALGTTSAISHYGAVHNPWSFDHIAGGSSGGSGAAVAAGLCFGAVGTDTGGSIRIPASCCGVVGLKPTFGVISTEGTVPISATFDHVGPLCRTVADAAMMFQAMTSNNFVGYETRSTGSISGLRIGILNTSGSVCDSMIQPQVQALFNDAVAVFRDLGAVVAEAELSMPDLGGIIDFESYAYHAEFLKASPDLYDGRTRATLLNNTVSRSEYDGLMNQIIEHRRTVASLFSSLDAVIVPTLPDLPIRIADAGEPFAQDACTFGFSIAGLPSISVPCGFSDSGLPVGLLIGGPAYSEEKLLKIAGAYEKGRRMGKTAATAVDQEKYLN